MRWTISRQIFVGSVVSLFFIILVGICAYFVTHSMLKAFEERRQTNLVLEQAYSILSLMQDAESGQRGFLLTGTEPYLAPYSSAVNQIQATLSELEKQLGVMGVESGVMADLRNQANAKLAELEKTIALRRSSGLPAALEVVSSNQGKQVMDLIREDIAKIRQLMLSLQTEANQRAQTAAERLTWVIIGGISLSALITLGVGFVTARNISVPVEQIARAANLIAAGDLKVEVPHKSRIQEIQTLASSFGAMVTALRQWAGLSERLAAGDLTAKVKLLSEADVVGKSQQDMIEKLSELLEQVQRSGVQVNSSAVQIAATSKEQQSTAGEMATTTTEISTTAKEMSATSVELLKAADNVNAVSQQLSGLASRGKEGLGRMEQVMSQIMEASSSITARLGEMNDKAGNISSVVTTITKIADQTNLLSLNAAIEAEKAGEYGRGFSVVAAEIRRLADQTASSTLDIAQMVKEMLASVSAGVMGMDKFSEEVRRSAREVSDVSLQIDGMIEQVQSLAPSVESVYEGMRAQSQGATQISEALSQLGDAARQTADSIRESNRAVEQLNEATRGLQTAISRFKLR